VGARGAAAGPRDFDSEVAAALMATRPGDVLTYAELAAEAGFPGAARAVGHALRRRAGPLPWWRVVTARGRLVPGREGEQARRLIQEGVPCADGYVRR